jgi:hypothetical protein
MRSRILVLTILSVFLTQPLLAYSKAGVITGGVIGGAGIISMIVSGAIMGAASDVQYCPEGTQEAVSGTYDCSYSECAYYQYNGGYYYCGTYSDIYGNAVQNCNYVNGYTTCNAWRTVPKTCNKYACKSDTTHQFQDYSHRKDQPRYDNSKWALIASAGVTGLGGLIALISGLACGGCSGEGTTTVTITTN